MPGILEATETSTLPPYGGIPSDVEIPGRTHTEKWTALYQLCSERGVSRCLKLQFLTGRPFHGGRRVERHEEIGGHQPDFRAEISRHGESHRSARCT